MDVLVLIVVLAVIVLGAVAIWFGSRRRPPRAGEPTDVPGAIARPRAPSGLRSRLAKTRAALAQGLAAVVPGDRPGEEAWGDIEDSLVGADLGVAVATDLVDAVRETRPRNIDELRAQLQARLVQLLEGRSRGLALDGRPAVVVVVGVNGGGKTTSVAKLAARLRDEGRSVLLGAADTFRAAAGEQLQTWAERIDVDIVTGRPGADPASVAFDSYQAARARGADVLIVDTAGRLQNKSNLMAELGKVVRVLEREAGRIDEVLLVVDGTTGQNALSQARIFMEAAGVTGIVMTKLDGTARGGVAVAIEREMDIPVKFIGVGEGVDDLVPFHPESYVDALLGS